MLVIADYHTESNQQMDRRTENKNLQAISWLQLKILTVNNISEKNFRKYHISEKTRKEIVLLLTQLKLKLVLVKSTTIFSFWK